MRPLSQVTDGEIMKLEPWLRMTHLNNSEFARLVQVKPDAVRKWLTSEKVPSPKNVLAIFRVTKGQVRPDDLYNLPKIRHEDAPRAA
jgi:DNA-binding transcriptional regulator YdaS (Cro superfamily)